MTRSTATLMLVILPLTSLAGLGGLWLWQRGRTAQWLTDQVAARTVQEQAWTEASARMQAGAREEAAKSAQRRQDELNTHWAARPPRPSRRRRRTCGKCSTPF